LRLLGSDFLKRVPDFLGEVVGRRGATIDAFAALEQQHVVQAERDTLVGAGIEPECREADLRVVAAVGLVRGRIETGNEAEDSGLLVGRYGNDPTPLAL